MKSSFEIFFPDSGCLVPVACVGDGRHQLQTEQEEGVLQLGGGGGQPQAVQHLSQGPGGGGVGEGARGKLR